MLIWIINKMNLKSQTLRKQQIKTILIGKIETNSSRWIVKIIVFL